VTAARRLLPLGTAFMLGACASGPRPAPAVIVIPGSGEDFAAFRQDDTICRRHAVGKTGYGDLAPPGRQESANAAISGTPGGVGTTGSVDTTAGVGTPAGAPTGSGTTGAKASATAALEPPDETIPDQLGYLQCMAARGDTVRPEPSGYTEAVNWYGYDYAYPYPYGYPYGFYDGGFIGVFAGGFHSRDFHRRFFHGGNFHRGFFHRGDFHHGGFRGGSFHGGGGHR
jgi:hypothetical protein